MEKACAVLTVIFIQFNNLTDNDIVYWKNYLYCYWAHFSMSYADGIVLIVHYLVQVD